MTTRSPERLKFLGYILSDGLNYEWFDVLELDDEKVTAKIRVNTGDEDENGKDVWKTVDVTADTIATGLRMFGEWVEGKRETYPGEWKRRADGNKFCRAEGEALPTDCYARELMKADRTNGDEGDYDANTADQVMQFALLGYNIFG